jgi:hypothetical protein
MKKIVFLLVIFSLFSQTVATAQTDSLEIVALTQKFLSNKLTQDEVSSIGSKWFKLINKENPYPNLPLDANSQVHYTFLDSYEELTTETIFNKTLEWLAISYSIYPSTIYTNTSDGKIIYNNSFTISDNYSCYYKCIITIQHSKMLIEFINIGYQDFRPGHYEGEIWIQDYSSYTDISQIFPIILKKSFLWDYYLKSLKSTNQEFDRINESLKAYVVSEINLE